MSSINFKDYLNEQLKDPALKRELGNETTKLESVTALVRVGKESDLSQRDLTTVSDVPQSTIARIKSGTNTNTDTLTKIANALSKRSAIDSS